LYIDSLIDELRAAKLATDKNGRYVGEISYPLDVKLHFKRQVDVLERQSHAIMCIKREDEQNLQAVVQLFGTEAAIQHACALIDQFCPPPPTYVPREQHYNTTHHTSQHSPYSYAAPAPEVEPVASPRTTSSNESHYTTLHYTYWSPDSFSPTLQHSCSFNSGQQLCGEQ